MCGLIIAQDMRSCVKGYKKMMHRGTTGSITKAGKWFVGHIRLPINGLTPESDPPFNDGDFKTWMVGEYYEFDRENYPCDLPDLANALRYGKHLPNGMYHAAVIGPDDRLFFYQDMWNKKPLYHRVDINAYASEIKALTCLAPVTLDEIAMDTYIKGVGYTGERTPYNEIKKLKGSQLAHKYSNSPARIRIPRQQEKKTLLRALREETFLRAQADVPIGMLCSGGIDSSILYCILRAQGFNPDVFHIENDESKYVKMLDIPPNKLHMISYPESSEDQLKKILYYNESPQDLGSMIPQYLLGQAIKEEMPELRVIITGDGADEIFAGYKRCADSRRDLREPDLYPELQDYHIPRLDKLMMAHTLEVRCPFMAESVTRIAQSIPWSQLRGKRPLIKLAEILNVPPAIIFREKKPLKSPQVLQDKLAWRALIAQVFKDNFSEGLEL